MFPDYLALNTVTKVYSSHFSNEQNLYSKATVLFSGAIKEKLIWKWGIQVKLKASKFWKYIPKFVSGLSQRSSKHSSFKSFYIPLKLYNRQNTFQHLQIYKEISINSKIKHQTVKHVKIETDRSIPKEPFQCLISHLNSNNSPKLNNSSICRLYEIRYKKVQKKDIIICKKMLFLTRPCRRPPFWKPVVLSQQFLWSVVFYVCHALNQT